MYTIRNLLKLIFVYLPIIFVIIGICVCVEKNVDYIEENLEPIVSQVATEYIGTQCKVSKIQLKGSSIHLKNIYIEDSQNKPLGEVEDINIKINPITLIKDKRFALRTLSVNNANLNIYRKDKWNFEFLMNMFKKNEIEPLDIRGPIIL